MTRRNPGERIAGAVILLAFVVLIPLSQAADDPESIANEAFELRLAGQLDEAVLLLEAGLSDHADAGILHHELARSRLMLLDIPGMNEAAEAAVNHEPDNSTYGYFAAIASTYAVIDAAHHEDEARMEVMGRRAFDQLAAVLQVDPDHHEARYRLVQLSRDLAPDLGLEVDDPEDHVRRLEADDPIMGAKARCCLADEAEQREIWERILAEHPEDCRALAEAAEGLIELGELELAESCLGKAMGKDKQSCYGLLRLGLAHAMKSDWDRAIRLTRQYLDTEPPLALKAFAVGRLGMIHHKMGDSDRGKELMEEARDLDPHVWQTVMPPPKEIFVAL